VGQNKTHSIFGARFQQLIRGPKRQKYYLNRLSESHKVFIITRESPLTLLSLPLSFVLITFYIKPEKGQEPQRKQRQSRAMRNVLNFNWIQFN